MKTLRKIGYVSIEVVITAALVLSAGLFGLLSLDSNGRAAITNGLDKLDALNIFGSGGSGGTGSGALGYDESLNIDAGDINPISDFVLEYNDTYGGYMVREYTNATDATVVIPKFHTDGKPIIGIEGVYSEANPNQIVWTNVSLESIALPDSIVYLGLGAFYPTPQLTSIIIPENVRYMDAWTFMDTGLTEVLFKGPVPSDFLGDHIFDMFNSLGVNSVGVPGEYYEDYLAQRTNFNVMNGAIYAATPIPAEYEDITGWYDSPSIVVGDVNPSSDFNMEYDDALSGWRIMYYDNYEDFDVVIPKINSADGRPIVAIDAGAFYGYDLNTIVVPNGIVEIGDLAFFGNYIVDYSLPSSLTTVGDTIFNSNMLPLSKAFIYADGGNRITSYGGAPGHDVTLNSGVKTIGYNSFYQAKLNSLTIPSSVNTIEWLAFEKAQFTTGLVVPNTVTSIGQSAFKYMVAPSVTLPAGLTTIGTQWFWLSNIPTVNIPSSVTVIEPNAFTSSKTTSMTLPAGLTTIGDEAFKFSAFTSMTIPANVTSIGKWAFAQCESLTSVTFLGPVPTTIGETPFGWNVANLGPNSIKVPVGQLAAYKAKAAQFGVAADRFYE